MKYDNPGKMFFNGYERYICIILEGDKAIIRKVLSYDPEKKTCKIRYKYNVIEVNYYR